jgi:hypothetical protein
MSGYLKQKLFQALHDLVAAGDIDERLTHAGNYLVHLQEPDIPVELGLKAKGNTPKPLKSGLPTGRQSGNFPLMKALAGARYPEG